VIKMGRGGNKQYESCAIVASINYLSLNNMRCKMNALVVNVNGTFLSYSMLAIIMCYKSKDI